MTNPVLIPTQNERFQPYMDIIKKMEKIIGQPLLVPKKAEGGYIGKLHNWNGQVPGPYGKEVNATLKAGTEGVYQQKYINTLKNGTMEGNKIYHIAPVINAAPGMDENAVATMAANRVFDKINQINKSMGSGRTISVQSL